MSQLADLLARETEIIRIIKVLSSKSDRIVIIGGYAINALTSHRFSVDCDIVTDSKSLMELDAILEKEGYNTLPEIQEHEVYGIKMKKYGKQIGGRPVTVELFPRELSCRQTDGKWAFALIKQNSSKLRVAGTTGSVEAVVVKKELLMAMKIHSGRETDLRDVTMLSGRANWDSVKDFVATGDIHKVKNQIDSAIARIATPEFASSLRSEFATSQDVSPLTKRTIKGLEKVKSSLE